MTAASHGTRDGTESRRSSGPLHCRNSTRLSSSRYGVGPSRLDELLALLADAADAGITGRAVDVTYEFQAGGHQMLVCRRSGSTRSFSQGGCGPVWPP